MKYIVLGTYTDKGLAGFVQNPNEDRGAAASKMIEAAGGKLLDMHLVRGQYDFVATIEIDSFEAAAATNALRRHQLGQFIKRWGGPASTKEASQNSLTIICRRRDAICWLPAAFTAPAAQ